MARGNSPSAKQNQFNLRLPDGMREHIAHNAALSGRSMNSEIIHRLANSFKENSIEDSGFAFSPPPDEDVNFSEGLNFHLLNSARFNKRSLKEEIEYRLKESFKSEWHHPDSTEGDIQRLYIQTKDKLERALKLLDQLSPAERIIVEERVEDVENYLSIYRRSKDHYLYRDWRNALIKNFQMRAIGIKRRRLLKMPSEQSDKLPNIDVDNSDVD